ncbi:MAG: UDP-3-O-(3-hydroxymyristoyl)glucosamine N-acyltransferase [Phycisphaeraceae bacterium]|nr:UDP-3-O-(3-hydroxymyristoyl)glucosamine N-acyltransferase [Phycisphaeraceae bacterium]
MSTLAQPTSPSASSTLPEMSASSRPGGRAFTAGQICEAVGGELRGNPNVRIERVSAIDDARDGSVTLVRSSKYAQRWSKSAASAVLISRNIPLPPTPGDDDRAIIVVPDADEAMIKVLTLFEPPSHAPEPGIHPTAVVDPSAVVPPTCRIGPNSVVGPRTRLGEHTVLHANVTLGADVEIGPASVLFPGVVIYDRCRIGAKTILHANVVVGADGFGYRPDPQGRGLIKIPHVGNVEIGSMVEIGSGTCIDRGKYGATSIGDGTKIDNLVQIGHNCRIGRACVICGLAGLAGSVTIGDGAVVAGKAGVADNVTIGPRATVTALAGILGDVPEGKVYSGYPGQPHSMFMRMQVVMKRLAEYEGVLRKLERQAHHDATGSIHTRGKDACQAKS